MGEDIKAVVVIFGCKVLYHDRSYRSGLDRPYTAITACYFVGHLQYRKKSSIPTQVGEADTYFLMLGSR
jgi:hypothetical protein